MRWRSYIGSLCGAVTALSLFVHLVFMHVTASVWSLVVVVALSLLLTMVLKLLVLFALLVRSWFSAKAVVDDEGDHGFSESCRER